MTQTPINTINTISGSEQRVVTVSLNKYDNNIERSLSKSKRAAPRPFLLSWKEFASYNGHSQLSNVLDDESKMMPLNEQFIPHFCSNDVVSALSPPTLSKSNVCRLWILIYHLFFP